METFAPRCGHKLSILAAVALLTTALSWGVLAEPSLGAAGPPAQIVVSLNPTSITADGSSPATVTATVEDASGNQEPSGGDTITFNPTGDPVTVGSVTDNGDGTYTAQLKSSKTAGTTQITASDPASLPSNTATLTQSPGPATKIVISLNPSSITADGHSMSTATATVEDANGNQQTSGGDTITFNPTGNPVTIGSVSDNNNGTYTATLTSSTHPGLTDITASDSDGLSSNTAALNQTQDTPASISVSLNPTSIVADGHSSTSASATVTDANGYPVLDENVTFASSDPGATPGPTTAHGDGTYTATIRSSTTPGRVKITATDRGISGEADLQQFSGPSSTSLVASPSPAVTNQPVNLVATVSGGSPSGTVTIENSGVSIAGCSNLSITPGNRTVSCTTLFGASQSPAHLVAVFSPDANSTVAGSTGSTTLTVSRDTTTTSLGFSNNNVKISQSVTYSAFVLSGRSGSITPSGSVRFLDHGVPISSCSSQPIVSRGGASEATCTITYKVAATHSVAAVYSGDSNFSGSSSGAVSIPVNVLGSIGAPMHWTFAVTPTFTKVLSLSVSDAPAGSRVLIICRGNGCPNVRHSAKVRKAHRKIALASWFAKHRLHPGTKITVDITRAGWIGRVYTFRVRSKRPPLVHTGCLAPGSTTKPAAC